MPGATNLHRILLNGVFLDPLMGLRGRAVRHQGSEASAAREEPSDGALLELLLELRSLGV